MRTKLFRCLIVILLALAFATSCGKMESHDIYSISDAVSLIIYKDTVWSGEKIVTKCVEVADGVTLTIMPGTKVKFHNYRGYTDQDNRLLLNVKGTIRAEGTADRPIYFTSDAASPMNGDWSMLRLDNPDNPCKFSYCVFEFAQHGINIWQARGLEIDHCVIRWNNWEGIYIENHCGVSVSHCQIYENGCNGIAAEQFNDIDIESCEVWRNGTCGILADISTIEVRTSLIHENKAHGLFIDDSATMRTYGLAVKDNDGCGIGFGQGTNKLTISNLVVTGNKQGSIEGSYTEVSTLYYPPASIDIGFTADQTHRLDYIPGDQVKDKFAYVYPDDETRRVVKKIGKGLGVIWSIAWDGSHIWTADVGGVVYELDPDTSTILKQFNSPGPQPAGMTYDGENLWIVDFAEMYISKVDPANGKELARYPTPDNTGGCKGVAWDGTNLCILGWTSANIYKLDRSGNLVGTIPLDSGGKGGIGWDGSCFWILNDNTICKYDAAGKLIGYINPLSERSYGYAWDGRYLWTAEKTNENWRDEKIYQVEVLKLRTKNPL